MPESAGAAGVCTPFALFAAPVVGRVNRQCAPSNVSGSALSPTASAPLLAFTTCSLMGLGPPTGPPSPPSFVRTHMLVASYSELPDPRPPCLLGSPPLSASRFKLVSARTGTP